MINKKLLAIAMGALAMGLASCGVKPGTTSEPESETPATSQETVEIPEEEGKTAIYFEVGEGSVALPAWASYYATGCWNGWATGAPTAENGIVEFQQLGDTNVYYGYITGYDDTQYTADRGFQLAIGYNASAKLAPSASGMNWTYKSVSCASWPGVEHPTYAEPTDGKIFLQAIYKDGTLGKGHVFEAFPPEPILLKNYSLEFAVSDALKEKLAGDYSYCTLAIKGSFNDWSVVPLDYVKDKDVYSIKLGDVIAGAPGEMCVGLVNQTGILEDKYSLTKGKDAAGKESEGSKKEDTVGKDDGVYHLGNLTYNPIKLDGDNHAAFWGTLDIPTKQNGSKDADKVAYEFPGLPKKVESAFDIVLKNSGTGALPEGTVPHFAGDFNGWPNKDHDEFTLGEDGTYTYKVTPTAEKPVYYDVAYGMKVTAGDWTKPQVESETGNIAIKLTSAMSMPVTVSFDFAKLGVEKTLATVQYGNPMTKDIKINVSSDSAEHVLAEGANLYVAGSWNGWGDAVTTEAGKMVKEGDKYVYTIPANTMNIGTSLQFGVITNSAWAGKLSAAGGSNFSFTIEGDKTNVNIVGDLSKCGVKDSVGTLEYVA